MPKRIIRATFLALAFPLFLAYGAEKQAAAAPQPAKVPPAAAAKPADTAAKAKDTTRAGVAMSPIKTPKDSAKIAATPAAAAPLPAAKLDTLAGEIVDIQCVVRNAAKVSADSALTARGGTASKDNGWSACGTEAVRRGAPVGIRPKDGKEIYLAVMQDRSAPGRALMGQLGKTVSATGHVRYEGGMRIFEIVKVMPAQGEVRQAEKAKPAR